MGNFVVYNLVTSDDSISDALKLYESLDDAQRAANVINAEQGSGSAWVDKALVVGKMLITPTSEGM